MGKEKQQFPHTLPVPHKADQGVGTDRANQKRSRYDGEVELPKTSQAVKRRGRRSTLGGPTPFLHVCGLHGGQARVLRAVISCMFHGLFSKVVVVDDVSRMYLNLGASPFIPF